MTIPNSRKIATGIIGSSGGGVAPLADRIAAYSPFMWLKMDETSGTAITDYGSGTHNGTWTAGAGSLGSTGIGDGGTSITFDGSASSIAVAGNPSLTMPAAYTIGIAMKLASGTWTDSAARTIRFDKADAQNYSRLVRGAGNGALVFQCESGNAGATSTVTGLSTTDWFWFFGTADTSDTNAYAIDTSGNVLGSDTGNAAIGTWAAGAALWQLGYAGAFLDGDFCHMMILPAKLTVTQLQALATV